MNVLARRFWPFTRGLRRSMALTAVLLAMLPLVQAAEVWLFKALVDDVLVPRDLEPLLSLAAAYVVLNVVSGVLSFGDTWLAASVGGRFVMRVRETVFGHLLRLSPLQLGRRPLGDVLTRLSGDIGAIESFLVSGPAQAIELVIRLIVFVGIMVWIDPVLAVVSLIATPLFFGLARRFSHTIRGASREKRRRIGVLQSRAEEALAAVAQVQAASAEASEARRFAHEGRAVFAAEMRSARVRGLLAPLVDLVELAGGLAVIAAGAWALSAERITLGELLAFLTYLTQLYAPVRGLIDLSASAYSAAASAERVDDLLREVPAVTDTPTPTVPRRIRGAVAFDNVRFTYAGATAPALDGVSLQLEPGTITAITGPSGSGKSTLAALLLRWADPSEGSVRLDGLDLRALPLRTVRASVAILLQDTYLFDGTIADNVAYGADEPGAARTLEALRDADAEVFVARLPDGTEHDIGPHGRTLSGGQRRRVALARVLYAWRPVVVLDEFSTGLDPDSTRRVLQRLRAAGRTVVLITHDPEVAEIADRLVVMEAGHIRDDRPLPRSAVTNGIPA